MLRGFETLKNGITRTMDINDIVANNMANMNTIGFKKTEILFKDIREVEIQKLQSSHETDPENTDDNIAGTLSLGPAVDKMLIDFSQGDFITTGNKLDFAINGDGFFAIEGENGEELYTKKGNFTIDSQGYLTTIDGNKVLDRTTNAPVFIEVESQQPDEIIVTNDGFITLGPEIIGALKVAEFADTSTLVPTEGVAFKNTDSTNKPVSAIRPQVIQGSLETSNANSISMMMKSLDALRSYESMSGAMQTTSDTLQKAVNQVGKF